MGHDAYSAPASRKLTAVLPSPMIEITWKTSPLRLEGRDVIARPQGEPNFYTPDCIKAAAEAATDAGQKKYADVDGTPDLKLAIPTSFTREDWSNRCVAHISVGDDGKRVFSTHSRQPASKGTEP